MQDGRSTIIDDFYRVVHDMKGEAGTFGYPLVTRIGSSLCRYLYDHQEEQDFDLDVLQYHVDAIKAVITNNIEGDGGEVGQALVGELEAMTANGSN